MPQSRYTVYTSQTLCTYDVFNVILHAVADTRSIQKRMWRNTWQFSCMVQVFVMSIPALTHQLCHTQGAINIEEEAFPFSRVFNAGGDFPEDFVLVIVFYCSVYSPMLPPFYVMVFFFSLQPRVWWSLLAITWMSTPMTVGMLRFASLRFVKKPVDYIYGYRLWKCCVYDVYVIVLSLILS